MRFSPESLNKKVSTPIWIVVIMLFTLLAEGFLVWQCSQAISCEIPLIQLSSRLKNQVTISTDKTEYGQGEAVKIIISNNSDGERWVLFPYYTIEKYDNGSWTELRRVAIPCGSLMPAYDLKLGLGEVKEYEWGQRETWCTGGSVSQQELVSQQVPVGEYRAKSRVVSDLESGFPGTSYSNEFRIKE